MLGTGATRPEFNVLGKGSVLMADAALQRMVVCGPKYRVKKL